MANIEHFADEDIAEEDFADERKPTLTFAETIEEQLMQDEQHHQESLHDVKKICKILRKLEMADAEIHQVIDIMLKKEEHNSWSTGNQKSKSLSIVAQLRKEVEEKQVMCDEANELANSLQGKLKNLRSEFAEEKSSLVRDKRELEEVNSGLRSSLKLAEDSRKESNELKEKLREKEEEMQKLRLQTEKNQKEAKELADKVTYLEGEAEKFKTKLADKSEKSNDDAELEKLKEKLRLEVEENKQLTQSVKEQQGVIKAALKNIYPNMEIKDYCPEHQESFDKFVAKMKDQQSGED